MYSRTLRSDYLKIFLRKPAHPATMRLRELFTFTGPNSEGNEESVTVEFEYVATLSCGCIDTLKLCTKHRSNDDQISKTNLAVGLPPIFKRGEDISLERVEDLPCGCIQIRKLCQEHDPGHKKHKSVWEFLKERLFSK